MGKETKLLFNHKEHRSPKVCSSGRSDDGGCRRSIRAMFSQTQSTRKTSRSTCIANTGQCAYRRRLRPPERLDPVALRPAVYL